MPKRGALPFDGRAPPFPLMHHGPMDPAVEGALIGSAGTALVAVAGHFFSSLNARRQLKSDVTLQLREPRKQAYAEFIRVFRSTQRQLLDLPADEVTGDAGNGPVAHVVEQRLPELRQALVSVELEGPPVVVERAAAAVAAYENLHQSAWSAEEGGIEEGHRRPFIHADVLKSFTESGRAALAPFGE